MTLEKKSEYSMFIALAIGAILGVMYFFTLITKGVIGLGEAMHKYDIFIMVSMLTMSGLMFYSLYLDIYKKIYIRKKSEEVFEAFKKVYSDCIKQYEGQIICNKLLGKNSTLNFYFGDERDIDRSSGVYSRIVDNVCNMISNDNYKVVAKNWNYQKDCTIIEVLIKGEDVNDG